MRLRVRHRHQPPKDIDLGPAAGVVHDFAAMRKPIDEAIRVAGRPSRLGHDHAAGILVEVSYR